MWMFERSHLFLVLFEHIFASECSTWLEGIWNLVSATKLNYVWNLVQVSFLGLAGVKSLSSFFGCQILSFLTTRNTFFNLACDFLCQMKKKKNVSTDEVAEHVLTHRSVLQVWFTFLYLQVDRCNCEKMSHCLFDATKKNQVGRLWY